MFWNNPAGGLHYHLRAFRHGRRWESFRAGLQTFLEEWQPQRSTLAIVGPSAGYCVPLSALGRFERFVVFEPDPVGRALFKRRLERALPNRRILCVGEDRWVAPLCRNGHLPMELVGDDAALLFTNIIGQLPYMLEADVLTRWQHAWVAQLFPWLKRVPWASFHDRVSSTFAPTAPLPALQRRLSDDEVCALYAGHEGHANVELCDHGSESLLPLGSRYRYLHWPLTPRMHHLIECVRGGPDAT